MKRMISLALCLFLLLGLAACGKEEPFPTIVTQPTTAPTEPPTEPSTEPETEPPTEPNPDAPYLERAQALLAAMTQEEKVYQLFMVRPEGLTGVNTATRAGEATQTALAEMPVGGIVYFAANLETSEQTTQMISDTQSYSKLPLFIGVDEEGGRVARVSDKLGTTAFDPMASYGAAGDTEAVRQIGATIAQEISSFGFNVDFAPVADVVTNPDNTEIGDRSFSSDPAVAAQMVTAMVEGLQQNGVSSCLKHFPGHGSTEADSHKGASVTERTLDKLRETELLPFSSGIEAGATMVMVSHMSAPNVTGDETPCDLSPAVVTDLLRGELGYRGVVITDSHEMGAITEYYSPGEAAVKALSAGCDIILMPQDLKQAAQGVLDALADGTLTVERVDESVLRILILKLRMGICE